MRDSGGVFTPKSRIPSIERLRAEFELAGISKDALRIYDRWSYPAKVLFVLWALSTISEILALDLFAVCFVLGAKGSDRYSYTRSLLNAYHHAKYLEKHEVTSRNITVIKPKPGQIVPQPPSIQKKPKRDRDDIGALGVKNHKGPCDIRIFSTWSHFLRHKRDLFNFRTHDDYASNLVPLVVSAIALEKSPQLKQTVDDDVESIRERLQDLLDTYTFLAALKLDERHWKVPKREAALHLTAFALFSFADWSWKPRNKSRCVDTKLQ